MADIENMLSDQSMSILKFDESLYELMCTSSTHANRMLAKAMDYDPTLMRQYVDTNLLFLNNEQKLLYDHIIMMHGVQLFLMHTKLARHHL